MSDVKHTPGPWESDSDVVQPVDGQSFNGCHICRITDPGDGFSSEARANAQLISAAPDLLEACKAALAYIPNSVVRSWPPGFELKAKALELLRSAIAKATGQ